MTTYGAKDYLVNCHLVFTEHFITLLQNMYNKFKLSVLLPEGITDFLYQI